MFWLLTSLIKVLYLIFLEAASSFLTTRYSLKVDKDIIFHRVPNTMVKWWCVNWSLKNLAIATWANWIKTLFNPKFRYASISASATKPWHRGHDQCTNLNFLTQTKIPVHLIINITWFLKFLRHVNNLEGLNVHGAGIPIQRSMLFLMNTASPIGVH